MNQAILLKSGNIIYEDGRIEKNKNILIKNGKIEKIFENNIEEDKFQTKYIIYDCTNKYITPSFVNLHCHSPMNIFRGVAEDVSINDWFNKKIWPYENNLNESDVYLSSVMAFLEMINNGITAVADHYFFEKSVIDAAISVGIKLDIAPTIFDENFSDRIKNVESLIKNTKKDTVNISLGPHSPYLLERKKLKEIASMASANGLNVHMHISETADQVKKSIEKTGTSPFEYLYKLGFFKTKTLVAHGLWIGKDDLNFIDNETFFAFCPKTYFKLSMGFGNIWKYKNNLNFSFGTDGAASSNTLNVLEQARIFALTGKILYSAEDFTLTEIWKSLMNGHRFFKFNSGKIKENFDSDLIIWNLDKINTIPLNNPLASIIYSSDSNNIEAVMLKGNFVKKGNKIVSVENFEEEFKSFLKSKDKILNTSGTFDRKF